MSVVYAPNLVLFLETNLELDYVRGESQFLWSISEDRCPHSMPHKVLLISAVDEVVVDGRGVDATGLGTK